jgi:hypothetical protein
MAVVNPYADRLTFLADKTRTRRDHMKYLTLIRAIALLHQHQREVKTVEHRGQALAYIEVQRADIELANRIAHEVLGRSLDELPPQTRRLLASVVEHVRDLAAIRRRAEHRVVDLREREIRRQLHLRQRDEARARIVDLELQAMRRTLKTAHILHREDDGWRWFDRS